MKIYNHIVGNIADEEWRTRCSEIDVDYIDLDQWTAQKSRFVVRGRGGKEYAVALKRHTQLHDGDILHYDEKSRQMVVLRLRLSDIMVIDLGALVREEPQTIIHTSVELGHAIGNQHWPAVVRGTKIYVPLTVDRKVMESVMRTHNIEHIAISFRAAEQIIPYLSPHEVRRLLGGATTEEHHHYAQ
ncbi:MAG: urease accessory protein UreE [Alistipes sp.]|nr:urease accessory protein UreE [Rikenellaceae bacterium]MBO5331320.1 urease accessory protein UreE [Alistipes sp.]MBQ7963684.1 urease accessory protein UreE [Alistipes sp.]